MGSAELDTGHTTLAYPGDPGTVSGRDEASTVYSLPRDTLNRCGIVLIPLTFVTLGLASLLYFVFFYWAYQAYQGEIVEVPFMSDWIKELAWL